MLPSLSVTFQPRFTVSTPCSPFKNPHELSHSMVFLCFFYVWNAFLIVLSFQILSVFESITNASVSVKSSFVFSGRVCQSFCYAPRVLSPLSSYLICLCGCITIQFELHTIFLIFPALSRKETLNKYRLNIIWFIF